MYIAGAEPQLQNIYGKVEYPVIKGTPMISPMLKWDHSIDYLVPDFVEKVRNIVRCWKIIHKTLKDI